MSDADYVFYAQQDVVHDWARNVFLSHGEAHQIAILLAHTFGFARPMVVWEASGAQSALDIEATTINNKRTGERTILFRGLGCTLLTLCHELVHCWRPWEEPHHDKQDWDLTVLLLEESRELI